MLTNIVDPCGIRTHDLDNSDRVVEVAQLVEVTDSAVLVGAVDVMSSNPARVKIFSAFTSIVDLLY